MVESIVLIEGQTVNEETLRISLANAKQIVFGRAGEIGMIMHIAATTPADLSNALVEFTKISGVTGVLTLVLRMQY
jgi:hypothetical protein